MYVKCLDLFTAFMFSLLLCYLLRPRERLRSIVMSMSVCVSVCPRECLRNHTHDLYQFFVHVAYVRGSSSSGMLTIGPIAYRLEGVTGMHNEGEV